MDDYCFNVKNAASSLIKKMADDNKNDIDFFCGEYYKYILSLTRFIKYGDFRYKNEISEYAQKAAVNGEVRYLQDIVDLFDKL